MARLFNLHHYKDLTAKMTVEQVRAIGKKAAVL